MFTYQGQKISMGESDEPCALVSINSIGRLGVEENKKHSEVIGNELEKLGISAHNAFIFFNEFQPFQVGSQKTTYEEIFKNQEATKK